MGGKAEKGLASKTDWDAFFRDAHLSSWPFASCAISNKARKDENDKWAPGLVDSYKAQITQAANKYGYKVLCTYKDLLYYFRKVDSEGNSVPGERFKCSVNFDDEASSCKAAEDSLNLSQSSNLEKDNG